VNDTSIRTERVIRRYANRKLYDATESRYVTLQDVEALVREGVEVRVVDNRSGEDVTQTALAQILADAGRRRDPRYTIGHLLSLFRRADLEERVRGLLGMRGGGGERPAEGSAEGERERERALKDFLGNLYRTAEEVQRRIDDRLAQIRRDLDPLRRMSDEVRELAGRVEGLAARLEALEGAAAPAARASRPAPRSRRRSS
jgi:polyhydroxyalkanoate synthesis repressor PhaR